MAITRKESLLKSISGGESANVSPITREEQYLAYIAGESNSYPITPITREEMYLDKIAKSGVSGGSGVNVQSLSVTENGTYTAPSGVAYSPVFVDVDVESGGEETPTQEKTVDITENGTVEVTADEGHLLSKVTANVNVNVASSGGTGEKTKLAQFVDKTLTEIKAEDLYGLTNVSMHAFSRQQAQKITFPEGLTEIGLYAFEYCQAKEIIVPNTLAKIGDYAFANCNIESFEMPDSVTSLSSLNGNAFRYCQNLKVCKLSNSLSLIPRFTFIGCSALEDITIPDGVETIGQSAFANCTSLSDVVIGSGVTSINESAFANCTALKKVTLYSTTVPYLSSSALTDVPEDCEFYVLPELVEQYKAKTNWAARADYIFAIEE